jgi:hypothetical protein
MKSIRSFPVRLSVLLPLFLLMSVAASFAQSFNILPPLEIKKFPTVQAYFNTSDGAGNPIQGLTNNDFDVIENGVKIDPSLVVKRCSTIVDGPTLCIVLVIDKSGSMGDQVDGTNTSRFEFVKSAAKDFVNGLDYKKNTSVAVVSFDGEAYLESNFSQDKGTLMDKIDKISLGSVTRYEQPLLDKRWGAFQLLTNQNCEPPAKRIIIFLTDGSPTPPGPVDSLIEKGFKDLGAIFYAITAFNGMNDHLQRWADKTGGKAFVADGADAGAKLLEIYRRIAAELQGKEQCYLTWTAPKSCDEGGRKRNVEIRLKSPYNLSSTTSYTAPANSVLKIAASPSVVYFGDPAPNDPQTQTVTITASTGKIVIDKGSILPPGGLFDFDPSEPWDGNSQIVIDSGKSRTFTIRFTQADPKAFRQGSFLIKGTPCDPPLISLVGGLSKVILLSPGQVGVDTVNSCEDITIKWAGVKPTDTVVLQYSTDGGKTWLLLKDKATGLSYTWTATELQKLNLKGAYKVKVVIPSTKLYVWAKSGGGPSNDSSAAVSLSDDGLYAYVCGSYQGTATFGTQQLSSSNGSIDGFVTKYDASGNVIWATSFGGTAVDGALGVVSVPGDVSFVTGFYVGNAVIGGSTMNPADKTLKNYFLGRLQPSGTMPFVYDGTKNKTNLKGESYGIEIAYEPSQNRIYVHGKFTGRISDPNLNVTLGPTALNVFEDFMAIHDMTGALLSLAKGYEPNHPYTKMIATDKDGCIYTTGKFTTPITFNPGAATVTSAGGTDYFLNKFCGLPASSDTSIYNFTLGKPDMVSTNPNFLYRLGGLGGKAAIGKTLNDTIGTSLCNYGTLNSSIYKVEISNDEFSLDGNLDGLEFEVPNCKNFSVRLNFTPKTLLFPPDNTSTTHCTDIIFYATCAEPIKIRVCAEAVEECNFTKKDVEFASTLVGSSSDSIVTQILCNTSLSKIIQGKLTLSGTNPSDFEIISVKNDAGVEIGTGSDTPFTLLPAKCLTVVLRFKPSEAGGRTAFLNYNVLAECGDAKSILTGNGLAPLALDVPPQVWSCTRPGTKVQQTIRVKNIGTGDASITALRINPNNGTFTIITPTPPVSVPANSDIPITIEYNPPTVGTHNATLEVDASSTGGNKTFKNTLTGEGCLPIVKLDKNCFPLTAIGSSSTIPNAIEITNAGSGVPLNITGISVVPPNTNEFGVFNPAPPYAIQPGQKKLIGATFTPGTAGNITAKVVVFSDGVPGRDTIEVCGDAFAADTTLDFGPVLTCDSPVRTVTYTNITSVPVDIDVASNSPNYFSIFPSGKQTIAANSSASYIVTFQPDKVGLFSSVVKIGPKNVNVKGEGKIVPINFYVTPDSSSTTRLNPGEIANITVKADILDKIENSTLNSLKFVVTYPTNLFGFVGITPVLSGWVWDTVLTTVGTNVVITINGTGTILSAAEKNKDLFILRLNPYLGDTPVYPVAITGSVPARYSACMPTTSKGTRFDLANICFRAGRLIKTGSTVYQLNAPKPSPASNEAKFEYGLGLSGMTEITLHNALGEQIQTLVRQHQESGTYEITLDVAPLPPGVYFYVLRSGPYMEQQRLYIAK